MVSFLHAADLHLGMRTNRFPEEPTKKIREARFDALDQILQEASARAAEFILIAGDLFDDFNVEGNIAERTFNILEGSTCPIYIISGNHDPLVPGSVWDRRPWADRETQRVRVLREPAPVPVGEEATLYPCPVFQKTSLEDPTAWIASQPVEPGRIRIGMAHGSLRLFDDLPEDDHLIAADAASRGRLDYLALGHWHSVKRHADETGSVRTAYCGVHETMRFIGGDDVDTGWRHQSGRADRFIDDGQGKVLHVTIDRPGAAPMIEPVPVGRLRWVEETHHFETEEDFGRLIQEVAKRPGRESCILRLRLTGLLGGNGLKLLNDLRDVLQRYPYGEIDDCGLRVEPTPDELRSIAGDGVLRAVVDRLLIEQSDVDDSQSRKARQSLAILYDLLRGAAA